MTNLPEIEPYDITGGEKVQYGRYAALEVVFDQYISELESYFLDEYNVLFELDYSIQNGLKFKDYLKSLAYQIPIVAFELYPLKSECLLILDNRSTNLMLQKETIKSQQKTSIGKNPFADKSDSLALKNELEKLLIHFDDSWKNILKVKSKLNSLVFNKIKAKVMDETEACIVVRIFMKQKQYKAVWEFCFSAYQLDRIIEKFGSRVLLAGNNKTNRNPLIKEYLTKMLLKESTYDLTAELGTLDISQKKLVDSFKKQEIIPIKSSIRHNITVNLNKSPMLSAQLGLTHDFLSLQINGKYEAIKESVKEDIKPFSAIRFPEK